MISRLIGRVFLTISLSISCIFGQIPQAQLVAPQAPQQQVNQELDAMQNIFGALLGQQAGGEQGQANPVYNMDFLQNILQTAMKKRLEGEMKKRNAALKVLTEDEQKIVMEAHDAYQSITEIVSIPQTLTKWCAAVREMVKRKLETLDPQLGLSQKEFLIKLDISLEKFHEALLTGALKSILKTMIGGGQDGMSPEMIMNPEAIMAKLAEGFSFESKPGAVEYTPEDLKTLCELLPQDFGTVSCVDTSGQNKEQYLLFLKSLEALKESNVVQIAHLVFEYNAPTIEAAYKKLENASMVLNHSFYEAVGISIKDYIKERQSAATAKVFAGGDKKAASIPLRSIGMHQDAYVYWYRELKKLTQTIATFNDLKNYAQFERGNDDVSSMELFRTLAYACDLGTNFFDLYKRECAGNGITKSDARLLVPYALDWLIRGGMSFWYYREQQVKWFRGSALQVAVGEAGLASQNQQLMMFSRFSTIAMALPVLWKPSFWFKKPDDFVLGASKILVAWSYYHTAHMSLFEKDKSKREFWPSSNKYLIESLVYGAKMATHSMSNELAWQVRRSVGHETLEKLEDYTWGIIDPEMIHEVMDSMIPYIFLHILPKDKKGRGIIVDTNRSQMYGPWYEDGVKNAFIREFKKSPKDERFAAFNKVVAGEYEKQRDKIRNGNDADKKDRLSLLKTLYDKNLLHEVYAEENSDKILDIYYEKSKLGSVDGYYIEHALIDYAASSIGRYWGRRITLAFKEPVVNLFNKTIDLGIDCLEAVGIISSDTAESILISRDDFTEDIDVIVGNLKEVMIMGLGHQSPFRPVLLQYLVEYGYLDKDEGDESEINRSITLLVLNQLVVNRLFTNSQAAEIIQACDKNDVFLLEPAVDKIIEGLRDSVIGLFGGWIGSQVLSNLAELLCWQYGPFYPKIKNAFAR